jgi:hypothetical protein
VVVVSFRSAERAHVEVSARRGDPPFGVRELEFLPTDARIERYRTIGYAAGTLVAEYLADDAERERPLTTAASAGAAAVTGEGTPAGTGPNAGSPPEQNQTTNATAATPPGDTETKAADAPDTVGEETSGRAEEDPPGSSSASPRSLPRAYVDLGVVLGTAFEDGGTRTGGAARGALLLGPAIVTASMGYSARSKHDGQPSASFLMASAGLGYFVLISRFEMGVRGEAVLERLASEGEAPSGRTGSAARFMGGARVGADVAWLPLPSLGVVAAGDVLLRAAPTELVVDGLTVATVPVVDFSLTAGLRLSFR